MVRQKISVLHKLSRLLAAVALILAQAAPLAAQVEPLVPVEAPLDVQAPLFHMPAQSYATDFFASNTPIPQELSTLYWALMQRATEHQIPREQRDAHSRTLLGNIIGSALPSLQAGRLVSVLLTPNHAAVIHGPIGYKTQVDLHHLGDLGRRAPTEIKGRVLDDLDEHWAGYADGAQEHIAGLHRKLAHSFDGSQGLESLPPVLSEPPAVTSTPAPPVPVPPAPVGAAQPGKYDFLSGVSLEEIDRALDATKLDWPSKVAVRLGLHNATIKPGVDAAKFLGVKPKQLGVIEDKALAALKTALDKRSNARTDRLVPYQNREPSALYAFLRDVPRSDFYQALQGVHFGNALLLRLRILDGCTLEDIEDVFSQDPGVTKLREKEALDQLKEGLRRITESRPAAAAATAAGSETEGQDSASVVQKAAAASLGILPSEMTVLAAIHALGGKGLKHGEILKEIQKTRPEYAARNLSNVLGALHKKKLVSKKGERNDAQWSLTAKGSQGVSAAAPPAPPVDAAQQAAAEEFARLTPLQRVVLDAMWTLGGKDLSNGEIHEEVEKARPGATSNSTKLLRMKLEELGFVKSKGKKHSLTPKARAAMPAPQGEAEEAAATGTEAPAAGPAPASPGILPSEMTVLAAIHALGGKGLKHGEILKEIQKTRPKYTAGNLTHVLGILHNKKLVSRKGERNAAQWSLTAKGLQGVSAAAPSKGDKDAPPTPALPAAPSAPTRSVDTAADQETLLKYLADKGGQADIIVLQRELKWPPATLLRVLMSLPKGLVETRKGAVLELVGKPPVAVEEEASEAEEQQAGIPYEHIVEMLRKGWKVSLPEARQAAQSLIEREGFKHVGDRVTARPSASAVIQEVAESAEAKAYLGYLIDRIGVHSQPIRHGAALMTATEQYGIDAHVAKLYLDALIGTGIFRQVGDLVSFGSRLTPEAALAVLRGQPAAPAPPRSVERDREAVVLAAGLQEDLSNAMIKQLTGLKTIAQVREFMEGLQARGLFKSKTTKAGQFWVRNKRKSRAVDAPPSPPSSPPDRADAGKDVAVRTPGSALSRWIGSVGKPYAILPGPQARRYLKNLEASLRADFESIWSRLAQEGRLLQEPGMRSVDHGNGRFYEVRVPGDGGHRFLGFWDDLSFVVVRGYDKYHANYEAEIAEAVQFFINYQRLYHGDWTSRHAAPVSGPQPAAQMPQDQVVAALSGGPLSNKALRAAVPGIDPRDLARLMRSLKKDGIVVWDEADGVGKWALPQPPAAETGDDGEQTSVAPVEEEAQPQEVQFQEEVPLVEVLELSAQEKTALGLMHQRGMSKTELGSELHLRTKAVEKMLDRLEGADLIRTKASDARAYVTTEAGLSAIGVPINGNGKKPSAKAAEQAALKRFRTALASGDEDVISIQEAVARREDGLDEKVAEAEVRKMIADGTLDSDGESVVVGAPPQAPPSASRDEEPGRADQLVESNILVPWPGLKESLPHRVYRDVDMNGLFDGHARRAFPRDVRDALTAAVRRVAANGVEVGSPDVEPIVGRIQAIKHGKYRISFFTDGSDFILVDAFIYSEAAGYRRWLMRARKFQDDHFGKRKPAGQQAPALELSAAP